MAGVTTIGATASIARTSTSPERPNPQPQIGILTIPLDPANASLVISRRRPLACRAVVIVNGKLVQLNQNAAAEVSLTRAVDLINAILHTQATNAQNFA